MMQTVILAGGYGTRIAEETGTKPKPMIEIGGKPLLWHVMSIYSHFGFNDFIICLGFKGSTIIDYFANYSIRNSDIEVSTKDGTINILEKKSEDWKVKLIDSGLSTNTGGRLLAVEKFIKHSFFMTYGDGLANVDLLKIKSTFDKTGKLATVTAVRPPGRFGVLELDSKSRVFSFDEKPKTELGFINGGFFALSPKVFSYIDGPSSSWEHDSLPKIARDGELNAHVHEGFWQPCDTLRDKRALELSWKNDVPPWFNFSSHDDPAADV